MWHGVMILHDEVTHRIGIMLLEKVYKSNQTLFYFLVVYFSPLTPFFIVLPFVTEIQTFDFVILLFQSCMWNFVNSFLACLYVPLSLSDDRTISYNDQKTYLFIYEL